MSEKLDIEIRSFSTRYRLAKQVWCAGDGLAVSVPPTRSDVLHACDVAEDVAIAFGYNNVAEALPTTATAGAELPLNQLTELLRVDLAAAGFTEVLTWALCSHDENFAHLRREDDGAVRLSNPATVEFQVRQPAHAMHASEHGSVPTGLIRLNGWHVVTPYPPRQWNLL